MTKYRVFGATSALLAVTVQALFASACSDASGSVLSTESAQVTDPTEPEGDGSSTKPDSSTGTDVPSTDDPDASTPESDAGDTADAAPEPDAETPPTETPDAGAPTSVIPSGPMPFRGVNLAGGEFGSAIPGTDGVDYKFPNNGEIDYFVGKGMNTFRFGFLWERLQPKANGEFVDAYIKQIDGLVAHATEKKTFSILNPHNFARYYGNTVGSSAVPNSAFADLWRRLATRFKDNPYVMFNLVNEPHDMSTDVWVSAANAAIAAIRETGAKNTIIAPGNAWTGAHSWTQNWYGTSNSVAMLNITDPADNTLIEVHQYLDSASSGGGACVSGTIGSERMKDFVNWLRTNKKKGFLGEFAGINSSTCQAAVTDMMNYMMQNTDVLQGWLWWAAGPGWGEYSLTIEPKNGQDRPQMAWISPFLAR